MNKKLFWIYSGIGLLAYSVISFASEKKAPTSTKKNVQTIIEKFSHAEDAPPIRIIPKKKHSVVEYRLNGKIIMIKITPKKGAPYFLVDSNGDGAFNKRAPDFAPELLIPQWTLFRW